MRYHISFLWVLFSGFFIACESQEELEPPPPPVKFPGVAPELKPYFQRFEDEAAARGIDIDLTASGITGAIVEIEEDRVLGQCSFPRAQPNRVTVDESYWARGSDLFKEFVVFHELGHCYLLRPHLEDRLSNGACASIMRSGNGGCFDSYNFRTRIFYVDELFDDEPTVRVIP